MNSKRIKEYKNNSEIKERRRKGEEKANGK